MLLPISSGVEVDQPHGRSTTPHLPAHEYSYRVPSPPRIAVPPPNVTSDGTPDFLITLGGRAAFESNGFANTEFLKTVTYGDFMLTSNIMDWKYEQRRMAQKILPFLFLGPVSAARDRDFLQHEGITMIMAVRDTMSAQAKLLGSKAARELEIPCHFVDVTGNQELIAAFPRAIEIINLHLATMFHPDQTKNSSHTVPNHGANHSLPGKVLVFCESGNERSATVVAAYMMAMFSFDLVTALQIIQAQRFCVSFDDSLRYLLQSFEMILRARRDVANHSSHEQYHSDIGSHYISSTAASAKRTTKRTLHDAYEDDTDVPNGLGQMDYERFEKRAGYAPFEDDLGDEQA